MVTRALTKRSQPCFLLGLLKQLSGPKLITPLVLRRAKGTINGLMYRNTIYNKTMSYSDTQLHVTEDIQTYTDLSWEMLSMPWGFAIAVPLVQLQSAEVIFRANKICGFELNFSHLMEAWNSGCWRRQYGSSVSSIYLYVGLQDQDHRLLFGSLYCPLNTWFLAKQSCDNFPGFDSAILPWVAGKISNTTEESHWWLRYYAVVFLIL